MSIPTMPSIASMTDSQKNHYLHCSVENGNNRTLKSLLKARANPNSYQVHSWETPLHVAARKSNTEAISLLLKADAFRYAKSPNTEQTPMDIVLICGSVEAVKVLYTDKGHTISPKPLELATVRAVKERSTTIVKHLLELNADPSISPNSILLARKHPEIFEDMLEYKANSAKSPISGAKSKTEESSEQNKPEELASDLLMKKLLLAGTSNEI